MVPKMTAEAEGWYWVRRGRDKSMEYFKHGTWYGLDIKDDGRPVGFSIRDPTDVLLGPMKTPINVDDLDKEKDLSTPLGIIRYCRELMSLVVHGAEDEGGRVYFGNSNHFDTLQELFQWLDSKRFGEK